MSECGEHFIDTIITTEEASGERRDKTEQKWKMAKQMEDHDIAPLCRIPQRDSERDTLHRNGARITRFRALHSHSHTAIGLQKETGFKQWARYMEYMEGGRYRARKIWIDSPMTDI